MVELGWTKEDAQAFCDEYGVTLNVIEQATTAYKEGIIIDQRIAPGSRIVRGTTFTITVAVKPKASPSPSATPEENEESKEETE